MKFKWGQKQLTFMLIPDANKHIIQWKLPILMIYATLLITLSLVVAATITLYSLFSQAAEEKGVMAQYFSVQIELLQLNMNDKDGKIGELQAKIIDLSLQAEQFKETLDQIKQLEN